MSTAAFWPVSCEKKRFSCKFSSLPLRPYSAMVVVVVVAVDDNNDSRQSQAYLPSRNTGSVCRSSPSPIWWPKGKCVKIPCQISQRAEATMARPNEKPLYWHICAKELFPTPSVLFSSDSSSYPYVCLPPRSLSRPRPRVAPHFP